MIKNRTKTFVVALSRKTECVLLSVLRLLQDEVKRLPGVREFLHKAISSLKKYQCLVFHLRKGLKRLYLQVRGTFRVRLRVGRRFLMRQFLYLQKPVRGWAVVAREICRDEVKVFEEFLSAIGDKNLELLEVLFWYRAELKKSFQEEYKVLSRQIVDLSRELLSFLAKRIQLITQYIKRASQWLGELGVFEFSPRHRRFLNHLTAITLQAALLASLLAPIFYFISEPQIAHALTDIIRPDGDSTPLDWTPTPAGTHYTTISGGSDDVTQPTAGDTSDFIRSATNNQVDEFDMTTIGNVATATDVIVWAYVKNDTNDNLDVDLVIDGTPTGIPQTITAAGSYAWGSTTFSGLSLSQSQVDGLRIQLIEGKAGPIDAVDVATMYAEVTFTSSVSPPDATSFTNDTESGLTDGGRTGHQITISGTDFGDDPGVGGRSTATTSVKIDTFQIPDADVTAWSSSTIIFIVSTTTDVFGGTSTLVVRFDGQDDATPLDFFVYPRITSFVTPDVADAARENDSITIVGNRFNSATGTIEFLYAGVTSTATVTGWSDTAVTTTIPTGIDDATNLGDVILTRATSTDSKTASSTNFRILPRIVSLSPTSGPEGTTTTISGDHFCQASSGCPGVGERNTATSTVTFNGTNVPDGDVSAWTATSVVALVPSGATTGPVIVKSDNLDSNGVTFTVAVPPNATSFVNDTDGSLTDGGRPSHQITVSGTDFSDGPCTATSTIVKIGTFEVPCGNVSSWASKTIVFTVPTGSGLPNGGAATSGLIIRKDNLDDNTPLEFFVYPRITSSTPSTGRQGDTITVAGDAFGAAQGTSTVSINGTDGTITDFATSGTSIDVTIDGGTITGNIVFTRGDDGKTSNNFSFTILPRITSPTPTSSPANANITISGDHFDITTSTVTINTATATIVSWADTSIDVTVPSGAAATGSIIVTRTDSQTSNSFSFSIEPTISSLSTSTSRVGDAITISGDHFGVDPGVGNRSTAAEHITINGTQVADADVTAWSDTSITANVPAAGTISGNVVVTANSLDSNGQSFTILPRITSPTPTSSRAGDAITISGDHFDTTTSTVTINGATSSISSWGDTSINVTVPVGGTATGSIVVTRTDSNDSNAFSFVILPRITTTTPTSGVHGDTVTVTGDHFGSDPGSGNRSTASDNVTFNTTQAPDADVTAWSDTSITVNVPIGATTGNVVIRRNNNDSNGVSFTVNIADATSFTNDTDGTLTDGGRLSDSITVSGSNFSPGPCDGTDYAVKIGTSTISCTDVSTWASTTIVFTVSTSTAVYGGSGASGLIIRAGGVDDSSPLTFFVYPSIDSITVPSGFATGTAREFKTGDSDGVITLNGTRFGTDGAVTVLGQTATTTSYTDTSVTLEIPPAIDDAVNTGNVVLTRTAPSDNKNATSTGFRILPRIISLSPNNGLEGSTTTISGNHFCQASSGCPGVGERSTATTTITFNGTNVPDADMTIWTATSVVAVVPTGAATGPVVLKSDSHDSNGVTFSVGSPLPDADNFTNNTESLSDGGRVGHNITVTGTDFGDDPGVGNRSDATSSVKIGTFQIPDTDVTAWSSSSITFIVSTSVDVFGGDGSAGIIVRANAQDDATPLTFFVYPDITSITTPSVTDAARENDSITLNGTRLGTGGTVTILGQSATVDSYTNTAVVLIVPTSITDDVNTGNVFITRTTPSDNKTDTVTGFRILPRIISLDPTSGDVGTTVTISGDHFCQSGACPVAGQRNTTTSTITFNAVNVPDADVTAWVATSVVVKAPTGATTGNVIVKSDSFDSNGVTFTIEDVAAPVEEIIVGSGGRISVEQIVLEPLVPIPTREAVLDQVQKQLTFVKLELIRIQKELEAVAPFPSPEPIVPPIPPVPPAPPPAVEKPITELLFEQVGKAVRKFLRGTEQVVDIVQNAAQKVVRAGEAIGKGFGIVVQKISETTLVVGRSVRDAAVGIPRFALKILTIPQISTPEEITRKIIPAETFVLRSGDLELVALKDKPVQTVVGYRFITEIRPVKPATRVSDTFSFSDPDGDGVWTAETQMPSFSGRFTLAAEIAYEDGSLVRIESLVLVDPQGYIFEQTSRGELRVADTTVTLLHREDEEWVVWPAERYGQTNPQVTDQTGEYSFLAPAGEYYVEVSKEQYLPFTSAPFTLDETAPVHQNIQLYYLGEAL